MTGPVDPGTGKPPQCARSAATLDAVDARNEVREFLTSRRAKITPGQAGLRTFGGARRVPGLRREEVSLLAGVSVDYYTRLERGNLSGVSETVLEALARALQLDDAERAHLFDLALVASDSVAILRSEAGRDPYDRDLSDVVGELSTQSELFRTRWAAHNVRYHDTGTKRFHHPVVGDLTLTYETMTLIGDSGLTKFAYTADAGSKSEEALNLLASWTATRDTEEPANVTEGA
jgi:transcriptional regulator with XRE-family HTH domain